MDNNYTHLPAPYNAVQTDGLIALMAHFTTCSKLDSTNKTWGGPLLRVGNNEQRSELIVGALDHVNTCPNANAIAAGFPNLYYPVEEPVMTAPEEPQPVPVAALDLSTGGLEGVVLLVNHDGVEYHYNLEGVAFTIPRMQLHRVAVINLTDVVSSSATEWELDAGQEISLHTITGGGKQLLIGDYAYAYDDVKRFLLQHGGRPEFSVESMQVRHLQGLIRPRVSQPELEAQQGGLLADRTNGVYTHGDGLTELPGDDEEYADELPGDPEYYDRELDSTFGTGYWFTHAQRWVLLVLGASTLVFTISTIMVLMAPHDKHSGGTLSLVAGIIGGTMLTLGIGLLGALATDKLANRPLFVECEHQGQWVLWVCGSIIGWSILCAIILIALITLPSLS